jgi:hypothetical protein
MRLVESLGLGALPVLLDDWSTPFDSNITFAVRWEFAHGGLMVRHSYAELLKKRIADEPGGNSTVGT